MRVKHLGVDQAKQVLCRSLPLLLLPSYEILQKTETRNFVNLQRGPHLPQQGACPVQQRRHQLVLHNHLRFPGNKVKAKAQSAGALLARGLHRRVERFGACGRVSTSHAAVNPWTATLFNFAVLPACLQVLDKEFPTNRILTPPSPFLVSSYICLCLFTCTLPDHCINSSLQGP